MYYIDMEKIKRELKEILERKEKYELIHRLRSEGWTLEAIAKEVNLSRQRVHQILTDPELQPVEPK